MSSTIKESVALPTNFLIINGLAGKGKPGCYEKGEKNAKFRTAVNRVAKQLTGSGVNDAMLDHFSSLSDDELAERKKMCTCCSTNRFIVCS